MLHQELEYTDAVACADALRGAPGLAVLDSAGEHGDLGRYAFVGTDPFAVFSVVGGSAYLDGRPLDGAPLAALREQLARWKLDEADKAGFPFAGGCIGHVAYDFGRRLERLDAPEDPRFAGEELRFGFYDLVIAFDRQDGRCVAFSSGFPETSPEAREARARARMDALSAALQQGRAAAPDAGAGTAGPWQSNFTPESYMAAVAQVQEYIRAGDIYQANISQRFRAELPEGFDHWAFFRTLRAVNPAPFGAFLSDGSVSFASSSPERFLRCVDGMVEARPIKGTAKRSADPQRDAAAAKALLESEKDRAENVMIVDLLRNDLSRVCAPGTVEVPMLCGLESYASVHHLTSVVTGRLRKGRDIIDLLQACFPGGSITGAPKLRAMDIITEIERVARGVYCGAIGYLGFDGDLDLNIPIRTVTLTRGTATFQVGGGITLLSDPQAEHAETLAKAQRIFDAFAAFAGGKSAERHA